MSVVNCPCGNDCFAYLLEEGSCGRVHQVVVATTQQVRALAGDVDTGAARLQTHGVPDVQGHAKAIETRPQVSRGGGDSYLSVGFHGYRSHLSFGIS